jgi:hypothetical protein
MGKAEIIAADEIYKAARQQADAEIARLKDEMAAVREESQAMGVLQKIEYDIAHNQMLKYVVLYRVKQAKEYRSGGLTWDQFCEAIGEPRRTADRILAEIQPIMSIISAKLADFTGMDFSKIRLLGKTVSANLAEITEDGSVIVGGESIPLSPDYAEDLQAALERVIEAKDDLLAEKDANLKTKERLLQDKQKLIERQARDLARYEGEAAAKGLGAEEDAFLKKCAAARISMDGFLSKFDPDLNPLPADATARMKAALMETLGYFKRVIQATCDTAGDLYGDPEMESPGWIPPNLRRVDGGKE